MFHLKRFVLHWAKWLLWYPAHSTTYLQVVINHTILLFVVIVVFSFALRFQVFYTISQPTPEWDGYEGRVSVEMILEILPPPPSAGHERELLIAACGPDAFTQHIIFEIGKAAVDLPTQPQGNERRNSKLMTSLYPDLIPLISRKFASSNKHYPIWVVTRHQYGISLLVPQASFRGETIDGIANSGCN